MREREREGEREREQDIYIKDIPWVGPRIPFSS